MPVSDAMPGLDAPVPARLVPSATGGWPRSAGADYEGDWPLDLDAAAILAAVRAGGGTWRNVVVLPQVGSTNTVGLAMATAGCPGGTALVTDLQTSGRGRLDRQWVAPPGTSALFSVVLRPAGQDLVWGLLPLLAGVAVAEAVEALTGLRVHLKWPNDLVVRPSEAPSGRGGKVGGILAERDAQSGAVVLGVGINVDLAEADLPVPVATSLTLAGIGRPDRAALVGRALARIEHWANAWQSAGTDVTARDALLSAYRSRCSSLGATLRVVRPGAEDLTGTGCGIGNGGELLVESDGQVVPVVVGDVVHALADW